MEIMQEVSLWGSPGAAVGVPSPAGPEAANTESVAKVAAVHAWHAWPIDADVLLKCAT